jgi:hypothetical protein
MVDAYTPAGKYEDRYFAFVDILGFQGLIERLKADERQYSNVWRMLRQVHTPQRFIAGSYPGSDFRAQSISDAVAISTAISAEGLLHMFSAIESMATGLLLEGFFIRGAIVRGSLYHDDHTVFGEALVRAYALERDVVRFPRVMMERQVMRDVNGYSRTDAATGARFAGYVIQAEDGPWFLNVLRRASGEVAEAIKKNPEIDYQEDDELSFYGELRNRISVQFERSTDNPRHFEKVQWFAKYWNKSIAAGRGLSPIRGPGLSPEPAVWGP